MGITPTESNTSRFLNVDKELYKKRTKKKKNGGHRMFNLIQVLSSLNCPFSCVKK